MSLCHHYHIITQSLSSRNHHATIMQSLTHAFHHTLTEIRREGTGGWVGGGDNNIRYDIHHVTLSSPSNHHAIILITQSSCHHHAISKTYAFHHTLTEIRREGTGGWVGGGDNNIRYDIHHVSLSSPSYHHAIIMQSLTYARTYPCTFVCGNGATGTQVSMLRC